MALVLHLRVIMDNKLKTSILTALMVVALPVVIKATEIMPDFGSTLPPSTTTWTTDRYEPNSFANVGTFQGRSYVLGIGINNAQGINNRPAGYAYPFYNTQGRQHAAVGGAGDTLSADLWVDAAWSDVGNGNVRTDVWGVMTDVSANVSAYPILGFTNYGGAARFRYWDTNGNGSWFDLGSVAVNFGSWNSLSIGFTGSGFTYSVNGVLVGSIGDDGYSTGFSTVIMQAYNFADLSIANANPQSYTAHWSNAQGVPDSGGTIGLLVISILGLAALRRRFAA
jgi:hypothetical protein